MKLASSPSLLLSLLLAVSGSAGANPSSVTVDFSNGDTQGWTSNLPQVGNQGSYIDDRGPNGPLYRTVMADTFGLTFSNSSNSAFVGDYTTTSSVTLGLDVRALSIAYNGQQVSRELVVELRDYDNPVAGMPYTSVWTTLGSMSRADGWQHFSVTIADTSSQALPDGWGGYGAEGDPALPPGRTFASVLQSVDEIVFTTYVPGYFYGWTDYHVAIDNISITAVPEPATAALQLAGLALLGGWMLRRRRA